MSSTIKLSGLFAVAFLSLAAFSAAPARAQDDDGATQDNSATQDDSATQDESAAQQLEDNEHSGQDAVQAPSDEAAKDLSGQGWDTPNTDPAPSSDGN